MTNHYVATVPVKFTDTDGQERTRFQRVGATERVNDFETAASGL